MRTNLLQFRLLSAARGRLCLLGAMVLIPITAHAQQSPNTQQIIEALKPAPTTRTRNIIIRRKQPRPAPQTAVPAPAAPKPVATKPAALKPAAPKPVAAKPAAPPSIDLTVRFDFNSSNLSRDSRPLLANLAKALKSPGLRQSRFLIEGHTDAAGPAQLNLKLSLARANQVRRYLVALGVERRRVSTAGRGENELINVANPLSGENRRVRIIRLE